MAWQCRRHPGNRQPFGKAAHWSGFTGFTRQSRPSRKTQAPSVRFLSANPLRAGLKSVNFWMNARSSMPSHALIRAISPSDTRTNPGQRQQFVHRWQT